MSTLFFERQETQRQRTRWLVWGFVLAILVVVLAINLVVLIGLGGDLAAALDEELGLFIGVSVLVLGTILGASLYKASKLKEGGAAVARALGGVPVVAGDGDLRRTRLLNVVEEMAIAARIRKPQVFVLPDEPGINAFAAGHSPDEAAVAVTQGALEQLDRDQLQAVIGHEFSHILNGDMRINMRLTAWIFGLFVITDLARRMMRGRSRGRDAARLKAIALGVFIAGSIGMFAGRLLQAAVSRRREHLADASAVQFTRNPQALQGAFIVMAAHAGGTRLEHEASDDVAHMFFAGSEPAWANKVGGKWFATHPPIEERVRAIDSRVTPSRFKSLVNEERRKITARSAAEAAAAPAAASAATNSGAAAAAPLDALEFEAVPVMGMAASPPAAKSPRVAATPARAATRAQTSSAAAPAPAPAAAAASTPDPAATSGGLSLVDTRQIQALSETLPSGIRMVGGRTLPPDVLRTRLPTEQQNAIVALLREVDQKPLAVQGLYVAALLAAEPARNRMQLTKLAPVLGIELLKETQAQFPRLTALSPAARLPLLTDLLTLLETLPSAERKRLRGVARAFAPTVAPGDHLRFALTRILERKLARPAEQAPPVALPERTEPVCTLYAALAQARFGAGKQGQNAYRAGLMGLLPAPKWLPYPESLLTPAALDAALAGVAQLHPTALKSFAEGMARVIAVGGRLTVPQVDLLRGICQVVECPTPALPDDVLYGHATAPERTQASAR